MPSHHTAIGANSLEHKERCDVITGEEWYILVKVYCMTASGGGKCIGFRLRIETGAERATIIDIFDIIQQVRDTGIHLKVDEEQWKITQGSKRQAKWVWSPRAMSGLRLPDTPHAQKPNKSRSTRLDRKQKNGEAYGCQRMTRMYYAPNKPR